MFQNYTFALDGKAWAKLRQYHSNLISRLIVRSTIFARFQPDQKTQLITHYQNLDYIVTMVGDGANDCGVRTKPQSVDKGWSLCGLSFCIVVYMTATLAPTLQRVQQKIAARQWCHFRGHKLQHLALQKCMFLNLYSTKQAAQR